MDSITKQLETSFGKPRILKNELLSKHTYMKVGGSADLFFIARSIKELETSITIARKNNLEYFIIGGGSNILVGDKGFRGLIVKNRAAAISFMKKGTVQKGMVLTEKELVIAESGVLTNLLVRRTIDQGLAGLEYFLGIPGTIGGAIFNNSHFQTEYIGNLVDSVIVLDKFGNHKTYDKDELRFAYDYSIFQKTHEPILEIRFLLNHAQPKKLWEKATYYSESRAKTQPLEFPSSGCIFKNIENKNHKFAEQRVGMTSAGFLIDKSGLKGTRVGNAMVSTKHASFIVNLGGATTKDILQLIEIIQERVKVKFGVKLAMEVFKVGEF